MQSFAVLSPILMISWIISPSASWRVPSSSPISTRVSSSSSLNRARVRSRSGVRRSTIAVLTLSSVRPTRSSNRTEDWSVNAPTVDNRYGTASAINFGTKSQSRTTTAKITIAVIHCGRRPARGQRQSKKRQSTTSGTLTRPSPSRSTFRTRRGLSRKSWMKLMSAG